MSECVACGAVFECGMASDQPCWCTRLPALLPVPDAVNGIFASCYCPACLQRLLEQQQQPVPESLTSN